MKKILVAVVLLEGCAMGFVGDPYGQSPPPPVQPVPPPAYRPAPPPPPRALSRDEAVQRAFEIASQHGLQPVAAREVERDDHRWKVKLSLAGGGQAKVEIDPWSAAELKLEVKRRGHHEHHGDEDEDDD